MRRLWLTLCVLLLTASYGWAQFRPISGGGSSGGTIGPNDDITTTGTGTFGNLKLFKLAPVTTLTATCAAEQGSSGTTVTTYWAIRGYDKEAQLTLVSNVATATDCKVDGAVDLAWTDVWSLRGLAGVIVQEGPTSSLGLVGYTDPMPYNSQRVFLTADTEPGAFNLEDSFGPITLPTGGTAFGMRVYNSGMLFHIPRLTSDEVSAPSGKFHVLTLGDPDVALSAFRVGTGEPSAACSVGDLSTRTDGGSNTTLYTCTAANTWAPVLDTASGGFDGNLAAGTTTTPPLKFTSGDLLTTTQAGAIEFLGDDYYATITTGAGGEAVWAEPPAYTGTYIKATSSYGVNDAPEDGMNPSGDLTGDWGTHRDWFSAWGSTSNQRYHVDLGSAKILLQIGLANFHSRGTSETPNGVKAFTVWGSNSASSFADVTYADDAGWTQLTVDISQWAQHVASDVADWQTAHVSGAPAYRYYAFKFATNWDGGAMGFRRLKLYASPAISRMGIGLTEGALISGRVPVANAHGRLESLPAATDGQVLTGVTGAAPTWQGPTVTALTDNVATTLTTIALADGARAAGRLAYAIDVHDASADSDVYAGDIQWVAQRKGATVTCSVAAMGTDVVTKSHEGTALAVVMSCDVTSGTSVVLKANADTALVATTLNAYWRLSRDF